MTFCKSLLWLSMTISHKKACKRYAKVCVLVLDTYWYCYVRWIFSPLSSWKETIQSEMEERHHCAGFHKSGRSFSFETMLKVTTIIVGNLVSVTQNCFCKINLFLLQKQVSVKETSFSQRNKFQSKKQVSVKETSFCQKVSVRETIFVK